MKKILYTIFCVVLVLAFLSVGLFSKLVNFKFWQTALGWVEDRFGNSSESEEQEGVAILDSSYHEQLNYYSFAIAEYVNTMTETKDFSMQYIDVLSGEGCFYYSLTGGAADITISLVDVNQDEIIDTFTFDCPLDDNLRKKQEYAYPIAALSAMALSMLEENYPGSLTENHVVDATSQIAAYFAGDDLDNYYEYYFSIDDNFVMFDIMFVPSVEGSTDGMISMCLTT